MTRYRLYTEDKNHEQVINLAGKYLPEGFTVFEGVGYWQGKQEKSLIIEVIDFSESGTNFAIVSLAVVIKAINNQQAILITRDAVEIILI